MRRLPLRRLVFVATVVTLAMGGVVLLGAGWLLKTQSGRDFVGARFQHLLKNSLHGGRVYVGHFTGSFLGAPILDSLEIRDTDDSVIVAAGRVAAEFDLVDLWDSRVAIRHVVLEHPVVHFRRDDKGQWNFEKLLGPGGAPSPPRAGRHLGDLIVIDSLLLKDGEFSIAEPWHPDTSLRGAARDSAIAHALARAGGVVTRAGSGYRLTRAWRAIQIDLASARLRDPDTAGLAFVVRRLDVDESDPPLAVRDLIGRVLIAHDTISLDVPAFRLPGSRALAKGTIATRNGLALAIHVVADTVSLADIAWLNSAFPKDGGGRTTLDIRKSRTNPVTDYVLSKMSVSTARSTLTGRMTVRVGAPVMSLDAVDVELAPLDFALFEELSGKPLALPLAGQLRGRVQGGGPLTEFAVRDATIEYHDANVPGVVNRFRVSGGLDVANVGETAFHDVALQIDHLDLRTVRALNKSTPALEGSVSGAVRLDSVWNDLRFHDADLRYAVEGAPESRVTGSGRVTVRDSVPSYDLSLVAEPVVFEEFVRSFPKSPVRGTFNGPFSVRGTGTDVALKGDLVSDGGRAELDVRLAPEKRGMRGSGTLTVHALDPARVLANAGRWNGQISGTLDAALSGDSLATLDGGARLTVQRSTVRGVNVQSAHTRLTFADGMLRVDTIALESDAMALVGSGGLGLRPGRRDSLTLYATVDSLGGLRHWIAPTVDTLPPDSLSGTVTARVTLAGRVDSLDADVKAAAVGVVFGGISASSVRLDGTLGDLLARRGIAASFAAESLYVAGVHFASVNARARSAGRDSARVFVNARSTTGPVIDAGAMVAWDSATVRATLDSLHLAISSDQWQLVRPAGLVLAHDRITIDTVDLRAGTAALQLALSLPDSAPIRGTLNAETFPIGDLGRLLQVPIPLSGNAALRVELSGTRSSPLMDFEVLARDARLGDARVEGARASGHYASRSLEALLEYRNNGAVALHGDAVLPIDLSLRPVAHRLLDTPLKGSLTADTTRLAVIESFTNAVTRATGRFDAHITLGGTWDAPTLNGSLNVVDGGISMPKLGATRYDRINLRMGFRGDSVSIDSLSLRGADGVGTARATAFMKAATLRDPSFAVQFSANGFRAINKDGVARLEVTTPRGQPIRLGGRVSSSELTGSATINGSIFVPEILKKNVIALDDNDFYRLTDTTALAVRRLLPGPPPAIANNLRVRGVTVAAGDNLWLRSDEATVKLGGQLDVKVGTNALGQRQVVYDGALRADQGTYRLSLGPVQRTFVVENGTVRFFGDPDVNPNVDIHAIYTVRQYDQRDARQDVRIRAIIGGTLSSLTARLESPDSLRISNADLVSYLVTGAPTFDIGGRSSDYANTGSRVLVTSLGSVLGSHLSGGWFDVVDVTTSGLQGGYTGSTQTVQRVLSGTRIGGSRQLTDHFFFRLDAGLCSLAPLVTSGSLGAVDPVALANSVGIKLDYRFNTGVTLSLGMDPATNALLCVQGATTRGFVPTPRQLGLDLFRVWRF